MVSKSKPKDLDVSIKFGGGLHTRASSDEIDSREAADGKNFILDLENRELRNRKPFDLIGTVPNSAEIRGGGSLLKADGTVSTIFQAGTKVYEWDGTTNFTVKGTVDSTAKLRGHWRSHNLTLNDKLLLTDINLADTVKEWDGTTFATTSFIKSDTTAFGNFYAKYLTVSNERAIFGNVKDGSATSPHLIVGSAGSAYNEISVTARPSSSLSTDDAFYLVTPDLRPINGLEQAFGTTIISTEKGRLFNLSGASAKDFSFDEFFAGSYAAGDEALAYIGNDIIYGRPGRIESVRDTASFGNSEADDLTAEIADLVEEFSDWTIAFNSRLNRVYLFAAGQSQVLVFNTAMRTSRELQAGPTNQFVDQSGVTKAAGKLSPWMKWTTNHSLAFMPTFVMPMLDPVDGLEYVFMGDSSGNIYRMEGSGSSGDGGSASIQTQFLSKTFTSPLDSEIYNVEGFIKYRKNAAATVTLTFLCGGVTAFDSSITVNLPALGGGSYFGGGAYFGGGSYFGRQFSDRLIKQKFAVPAQMSDFQVRVDVTGTTDFSINSIDLRFMAAS